LVGTGATIAGFSARRTIRLTASTPMNPTDGSGPVSPLSPVPPGLSPQQVEQISLAYRLAGPVRRAIAVANFNGWTLAIAAVLTGGYGGLSFSFWGVALGVVLGVLAWNELAGAAGLRRFDLKAPRRLARNQIALGVVLAAYATWQLVATLHGGGALHDELAENPDLAQVLGSDLEPVRLILIASYAGLLAFAIICQGAMALYYYTRSSVLRIYVEKTPDWVRNLQQAGALKF
jgi:hypothetical protein